VITWHQKDPDTGELRDAKDVPVDGIRRVGGSWECRYGGETIAVRPDAGSALRCVTEYHRRVVKGKEELNAEG
jgi:hypothetical protein